jgi:hypothetical protein
MIERYSQDHGVTKRTIIIIRPWQILYEEFLLVVL